MISARHVDYRVITPPCINTLRHWLSHMVEMTIFQYNRFLINTFVSCDCKSRSAIHGRVDAYCHSVHFESHGSDSPRTVELLAADSPMSRQRPRSSVRLVVIKESTYMGRLL